MRNTLTIDADIKRKTYIPEPVVTSNDDIVLLVSVTDDGSQVPMDLVTTALLANKRGDRQTVLTPGTIEAEGTIRFELETSETAIPGQVKAVVQLYNAASERISTIDFSYKVLRDPTGENHIPSEKERTLIQVVLEDGPGAISAAQATAAEAQRIALLTEAERVSTAEERKKQRQNV